jgi:cobalamin biosynthesis protein CobD/CbiB
MSLLSLIAALLLERFRPLGSRNQLYSWFARYANYLEHHFNAGQRTHGIIAWILGVLVPVGVTGGIHYLLYSLNAVLALVWAIVVLYFTVGFRSTGKTAEGIAASLRVQDFAGARGTLTQWHGRPTEEFDPAEIARVGIERTLTCAHRQLFGAIPWFVLLGPAGAVLYRFSQILAQKWGNLDQAEFGEFGKFTSQVFDLMDWVPLRLTALSFAVVGDFEDAIYCWRTQAAAWAEQGLGIVLASGAGALGVRLGEPLRYEGSTHFRPEMGLGDEADADYLQSAVSLVWRAIVLWLALILLFTIARWVGG